ncbi:MAG TPA: phage holin family protein [Terriglobales bacterium]|nr:phage holin family protein [Terriglobales bacterium]
MNETRYSERNGRRLGEVVAEIKDELKEFLQTRVQMLIAELREAAKNSKSAVIFGGAAALLLGTAWLLLNLALVGLVAVAFWGSPYAWFFAFLIVGMFWAILGDMLGLAAVRKLQGLAPKKTIEVLKQDKVWLQQEARSQV